MCKENFLQLNNVSCNPICVYCSQEFILERKNSGYDYCLSKSCQKIGMDKFERDFRKVYTVALLHKSNYFWHRKDDLKSLNVRADLDFS